MRLTEHERERLLITLAADVAERRRGRGLKLNHPETVAVFTSFVLAGVRDGRTVAADPGALIVCRDSQVDVRLELTLYAGTGG
jgi:urease gamma subunit